MLKFSDNRLASPTALSNEVGSVATPYPPAYLEYAWYLSLTYAMLGQAWGVVIPAVGGVALAVLAGACFLTMGGQVSRVYAPTTMAICTGISMIAIQYFFHSDESFEMSIVFLGWLCSLIVIQTLALRQGFLHRFALVAFAIGLCVLPFVGAHKPGALTRMAAIGTGIANPNALAMWFGFCTVYFLSWGLRSHSYKARVGYWTLGLSSLFVVTLTVSRGALLAAIFALMVGFQSTLKRHVAPLFAFLFLLLVVYLTGVFDPMIDKYTERGMEETGRGKVWPVALERALDYPWIGVGLASVKTMGSTMKKAINPHNVLLYMALAGGIIPLICFLGYLFQAAIGAFRIWRMDNDPEIAILPPLVTFGLLEIMATDAAFMTAWVVVVFALAALKRGPSRER